MRSEEKEHKAENIKTKKILIYVFYLNFTHY